MASAVFKWPVNVLVTGSMSARYRCSEYSLRCSYRPHNQPGHVWKNKFLEVLGRLLSKYCAEFIELMAFLMALALAVSPSFDLSQTRITKSALNGMVCPCMSA